MFIWFFRDHYKSETGQQEIEIRSCWYACIDLWQSVWQPSLHRDERKQLHRSLQLPFLFCGSPPASNKMTKELSGICDILSHQNTPFAVLRLLPIIVERKTFSSKEIQIQTPWTEEYWVWWWRRYIGVIFSLEFKLYLEMKSNNLNLIWHLICIHKLGSVT